MSEDTPETDQIEKDLARTRARMDHRLDELQEKLTPAQMLNDAFASFRGGDGADFTKELLTRAKANPLPLALTGIGLAWLMASSGRSEPMRTPARPAGYEDREDDLLGRVRLAEGAVVRGAGENEDAHASRLDDARGKVFGIARDASDTAASYGARIKEALASAAETARRGAHDLQSKASDAASNAGNQVSRGSTALQEGADTMATSTRDTLSGLTSNALALGAIAAVVGLVAGAIIPTSDEEQEALGSTAAKLRQSGSGLAQSLVDKASNVASDAVGAVKDSAASHGLTADKPVGDVLADGKSGALIDDVKRVASETMDAGRQSAQDQFARSGDSNKPGMTDQ